MAGGIKNSSSQEMQELDGNNAGRFQVAKVDGAEDQDDDNASEEDDDVSADIISPQYTYVYDTRYAKSLGQLTREALPRADHYRNLMSVVAGGKSAYRPTIDELHGENYLKPVIQGEEEDTTTKKGKVIKFGWIEGVFMRCLLNIWGVMLFLRLSWVIGQAGIIEGIIIICLANLVTVITSISMSAVSTNGQIKAGGIYYMISRSLGPEFGGAIGLMFTLANSIAVSLYIVGFCESLGDLLEEHGLTVIDGGANDIRVVGSATLVAILVLAFVGMDWVTRFQMGLLFVLIGSQIDFIIGTFIGPISDEEIAKGFPGYNSKTFTENVFSDYKVENGVQHDFFSVFGVFFPAVTGIVAGANLSGDLKDPSKAIPIGTLSAILVTFISYIGYAFMMGGCLERGATGNLTQYELGLNESSGVPPEAYLNCTAQECLYGLQYSAQAMELSSIWGPLIYGGCFAATLSSAIASLVGAPRVLQALAKDKLYPLIGFFAQGYGANNDPVRGYCLVFIIALGCVLIAELNAIAPLLSNFFLAAYCLINFSVFHASISKSPGWRPAFKYYNAWVSLIGTILCLAVMFLMSWQTALVTFGVTIALYLYVSYRKPEVNWGSSTQAQSYNTALKSVQELNYVDEHVKNYRPQVLVLTGMPSSRPPLVDFANLITKKLSLLMCGHVVKGPYNQNVRNAFSQQAYNWLHRHKVKGFYSLTEEDGFEKGVRSLMQLAGLGKLRPNMILLGYKGDWKTCSSDERMQYFNVIHDALDTHLAVGILRVQEGLDYSNVIEEEDKIAQQTAEKEHKEFMRRNQSAGQLSQDGDNNTTTPNKEISVKPTPNPKDEGVAAIQGYKSRFGTTTTYKLQSQIPKTTALYYGNSSEASMSPPSSPKAERIPIATDPAGNGIISKEAKKKKRRFSVSQLYQGPGGMPLPKDVIASITQFQKKQKKGSIDVWWLYDDGGLTLLLPYILSTRSQFSGCKLRIFSLSSRKDELDSEARSMAGLLSKFRIDYSDVIVIPDITKKAQESTKKEFENLITPLIDEDAPEGTSITEAELLSVKEKTNRHMRLRELLQLHSKDATIVVMTLPMPRKGTVSAPLYMAWLEIMTKGMPPFLIVRGNQTSVLTFYS